MKSSFRENDIVGRIGGDEFLIFMEGITSEEFAVRRMENLQQYLRELPIEELEEHTLTCSMGAAFMPKDGTTFGESVSSMLMKHFIQDKKKWSEMDLESIMRWKRKKYRYFIQIPRKNLLIF